MPRGRYFIVPIYDEKHPFKDCLRGWCVIMVMSLIFTTIIGVGIILVVNYLPIQTTNTTVRSSTTTTSSSESSDTLFSNTILPQNYYLLSNNNIYRALMKNDGNLIIYRYNFDPKNIVWHAGTGGRPLSDGPFYAEMEIFGNLVIYKAHSVAIWDSGTYGKGYEPHRLVMQDDGKLVIYDGLNRRQWSSQ